MRGSNILDIENVDSCFQSSVYYMEMTALECNNDNKNPCASDTFADI